MSKDAIHQRIKALAQQWVHATESERAILKIRRRALQRALDIIDKKQQPEPVAKMAHSPWTHRWA